MQKKKTNLSKLASNTNSSFKELANKLPFTQED